ncbi:DUF6615 family protein [Azospirillum fermentarium]|uniref:DUF6615 family protein n=1 Tax=Azospirillum fermentarium TaxID=1233114 RepID=UPI003873832B
MARQFPPFVESFLERSRRLRRRFREETVTDLLMGNLIRAGRIIRYLNGRGVTVHSRDGSSVTGWSNG